MPIHSAGVGLTCKEVTMRYVWLLVIVVVASCQQQPRLLPQLPPVGRHDQMGRLDPNATAKIVSKISQPPVFNPGNVSIDLLADPSVMQTMPKERGVKQVKLTFNADVLYNFAVTASGQDVHASDIIISLQPVLQDQLWFDGKRDALNTKEHRYAFMQAYIEGESIAPLELVAMARRKSYCEEVFTHNTKNGNVDKLAVGGLTPDIPSSAQHCGSFNEIYNFDQRMRVHLHIKNVPNPIKQAKDDKLREAKEKIYCNAFNRVKNKVVGKLTQDFNWGGAENSWQDIFGDIVAGTVADIIQYKLENQGFDCSKYLQL